MSKSTAVVLVNLGTPTEPTRKAVAKFLKQFLSDPRVVEAPRWYWLPLLRGIIAPLRSRKTARAYQKVWTDQGSPLKVISQQQVTALQDSLSTALGIENAPRVVEACTYGSPSLTHQLGSLTNEGVEKFIVIPLYPQYSCSTTAAVWDQLADFIKTSRNIPDIQFVKSFYAREDYIAALASSVQSHWQQNPRNQKLLMTFHGVPQEYVDKGDPYEDHCRHTARELAAALSLKEGEWLCTFQSRFGPKKWLQPYTDETLKLWASEGVKSIDVISPAFTADCLETLEELKIENRQLFLSAGGENYAYIPCLNNDEKFITVLKNIVLEN